MQQSDKSKAIKEKLEKLIRKRDSAESLGNLQEAEAFAQKIQQLAIEYGVSLEEIQTGEERRKPIGKMVDITPYMKRHESDWIYLLFHACARGNMCMGVGNFTRTAIDIIGAEHNIEIAIYMAESLITQFRELARKDYSKYGGDIKRNTYIRGWLRGATQAIKERLTENLSKAEASHSGTALMIRNQMMEVKEEVRKLYPHLSTSKSHSLMGKDGQQQGYATGKTIGLNKGVGGSNGPSSRLLA